MPSATKPPLSTSATVITPPPTSPAPAAQTAIHFSGAFSLTLEPGTDFGPRYRIESLLGEGGMGTVYKAYDKELGRTVALKLVRPEYAANPAAMARFRQELLLASKISHKNILRIHDLGDAGGMKFISMAFVEGQDLGRLMEHGRLPMDRILSFTKQLCSALDAAHSEEVVHRDLKPNNILIDKSDNVFVMDFGLAKSFENDATMMTRTGQILGTPRYMAPEQVEAKPVDHRADIYSFGLIVYELLAGDIPFQGNSAMQLMYQRVTQPAKDIRETNPEVPEYLANIVMRCIAREPETRYQSARQILADIEAQDAPEVVSSGAAPVSAAKARSWRLLAVGMMLLVVVLAAAVVIPRLRNKPAAVTTVAGYDKYVAVLPFQLKGDDTQKYLADGVVESLDAELVGLKNVYVASPSVAERVSLSDPLDKIGRSLGVKQLIGGTLEVTGDNLKLQVTLDDAASKKRIWTGDFSGLKQDLLQVENQISTKVIAALDVKPSNDELARITARPTENMDAYELYLKGRNTRGARDVKSVTESISLFEQATKKDAGFAQAYAGLASSALRMYELTKDSSWTDQALAAATQGQRLNDNLAEIHVALGAVYQATGQNVQALVELKRALDLAPNSDEANRRMGTAYMKAGKKDLAIQAAEKATKINPYYFVNFNFLGSLYDGAGEYEKAAQTFGEVTKLEPDNYTGYLNQAAEYFRLGKYKESIPLLKTSIEKHATYNAYEALGSADFYLENYSEAVKAFQRAVELSPNQYVAVGDLADAYRWSGEVDKSLAAYKQAIGMAYKAYQVNSKDAATMGRLALYYAKTGDGAQALGIIKRARAVDPNDNGLAYKEGVIHAMAGRTPDAIASLREAFQKHYSLTEALHDPELAKLRSGPEFKKLAAEFQAGKKQ